MQTLVDLIVGLGPWNWLIFAVFLIVLETFIPGIHFVWFGMAAIVVGIVALATGIGWEAQVLIFGILSIVTAVLVRRYAISGAVDSDKPGLNERGSYYVGRVVVIEEAVTNGRGRARVGDTLWSVSGPDLPIGAKAKVTQVDGTVLVVEAAD